MFYHSSALHQTHPPSHQGTWYGHLSNNARPVGQQALPSSEVAHTVQDTTGLELADFAGGGIKG